MIWHWIVAAVSALLVIAASVSLGFSLGKRAWRKSRQGDIADYAYTKEGEPKPSYGGYRDADPDPEHVSAQQTPGTAWALRRLSGLMVGVSPIKLRQKSFKAGDNVFSAPMYSQDKGYAYYYDLTLDVYVYVPAPGKPPIFDKDITAWAEKCAAYDAVNKGKA